MLQSTSLDEPDDLDNVDVEKQKGNDLSPDTDLDDEQAAFVEKYVNMVLGSDGKEASPILLLTRPPGTGKKHCDSIAHTDFKRDGSLCSNNLLQWHCIYTSRSPFPHRVFGCTTMCVLQSRGRSDAEE